jgi:hypothetical protein
VICGMATASCVCEREDAHEDHVCSCGGSWKGTEPNEIDEVLKFPGGQEASLDAVLDLFDRVFGYET